ncbi:hypothetical protein J9978_21570 [Chromobacterium violaceum]|uniref:hypothetical protein n=1 Tax=Chromobacterium violaceum TaxID=536 RepID=UPI00111C27DC|nr:hypothetical protein [Chromobacterium violaceum]MBP4052067.1 hypothetical protein [Chromobacterium violaceum]
MQKSNKLLIASISFLSFIFVGYAANNYLFDSSVVCTAKISEMKFPRKNGMEAMVSGFIDLDMKNGTAHFFFQSGTGDFVNRILQFSPSYAMNGEAVSLVIERKNISKSEYGGLADEYHLFDVGTKHLMNFIPVTNHVTQVNFGPLSFFCENEERL